MRNNNRIKCFFPAIFLSCFFTCSQSFAQPDQFVFHHLTSENGLINNIVHSLYQDKKGYVWIGTIDGLQRYDGSRFVSYLPDMHDPGALHNGWINTIFEDSKNRFWVGTSIGAPYLLNRSSGKFYNYGLHLLKGSPVIKGVSKFLEDETGDIWLINDYGYFKLNNTTNQFENFTKLAAVSKDALPLYIDKDDRGNIWFVTQAGFTSYNPASKMINDRSRNPGKLKIFNLKPDLTAFLISGNNFWIGIRDRNVLLKYDISVDQVTEYPFKNADLKKSNSAYLDVKTYKLTGSSDGSVIVDLFGLGIAFYDPVKDSFTEISVNNEDPNGLHGLIDWGTTTLKDREGNMWVTGDDKGLNIFNPAKRKFTFYGTNTGNDTSYSANGFLQDAADGDIYVGYYYPTGGITRFSRDLSFKKKYLYGNSGNTNTSENQAWCLFQNEDGNIWAPNQSKTILNLDTRNDKLSVLRDTALSDNINTLEKDEKSDIWIGCWMNGLKKIDHLTHRVNTFLETGPGSPGMVRNIFSLCFEGDSMIWTGTNEEGLLLFDKRLNRYTQQYLVDEKDPSSISSNIIKKIIRYNDDTLLLATGMGINIFDIKKKLFSNISTKDGLPGNVVETIILDDKKKLLAACDGGFCKINMHTGLITRYGTADGIIDKIFINASLKLKNGNMLVATENGFISFNPDKLTDSPPANPLITGFKVFDKPIHIDSLMDAGAPVKLSYHDNSIVVEFSSLQYNFSDESKYYYKLEGVDPDWVLSGKEQAAHYNQLQSGDYVFSVKSVNRDGQESQKTTALLILITPPFWKTWWFRLIGLLAAVFLVYLIMQQRIRKIKTKEAIKQQITELEIKALKAQMNPHFIFNAMNSIQEFTLMGEVDNANKYISKFSKLLRKVLHQSQENSILLSDEIETLNLYLEIESVRLGKDFSYSIHTDNEAEAQMISIPSMLLQPFVENALHHGLAQKEGKKHLQLNFMIPDHDSLVCEIIDNGIGREKAKELKDKLHSSLQHESLGIKLVEERLRLTGNLGERKTIIDIKDIVSDASMPGGTKVIITIPQL
jgi:ligand-binding sensor domain-containing protein/uncharacterized membrane-anchored protein YhcB (DUF1043 family)